MLAGKDVPAHLRGRFRDLVNSSTGKFENEFVQSLDTKEAPAAKKQAHRIPPPARAHLSVCAFSPMILQPSTLGATNRAMHRQGRKLSGGLSARLWLWAKTTS